MIIYIIYDTVGDGDTQRAAHTNGSSLELIDLIGQLTVNAAHRLTAAAHATN